MKNLIAVLAIIAALAVTLPARAALLSYDDFNEGLTNYPTSLHMSTNGFGWRAAWTVQGTGNTGYRITNGPALFYLDGASQPLLTNGMLAAGGDAYTSSGRRIGLSETWEPDNAYTPYRKVFASAAYVGAEDTVLWFSALVRQQASGDGYKISLHANNIDWNEGSGFPYTRIAIGLSGGVWQLQVYDTNNVLHTSSTGVTRVLNTTYLMVLRMAFAEGNDVIELFVNPASIGGVPPVTPSATVTVTDDVFFRNFRFYPGSGQNNGYVDEVRIGESYAVVTPIPEPAFALALAGLALVFRRK